MGENKVKLQASNIDVFYSHFKALKNINLSMYENSVTAFIGPSGCGKSTFLRLFNRMNDYVDGFSMNGDILIDGKNIYDGKLVIEDLRKEIGMVFQKPNPFPNCGGISAAGATPLNSPSTNPAK